MLSNLAGWLELKFSSVLKTGKAPAVMNGWKSSRLGVPDLEGESVESDVLGPDGRRGEERVVESAEGELGVLVRFVGKEGAIEPQRIFAEIAALAAAGSSRATGCWRRVNCPGRCRRGSRG